MDKTVTHYLVISRGSGVVYVRSFGALTATFRCRTHIPIKEASEKVDYWNNESKRRSKQNTIYVYKILEEDFFLPTLFDTVVFN